jgi:choline-sulfatase
MRVNRMSIGVPGVVLALALMPGCQRTETSPTSQGPRTANVVLITLDTTRADHLGCYAGARPAPNIPKTPNLDAVAARGTRFDYAIAQAPLTLPSHASIMTGANPVVHGLRDMEGFVLDAKHPTLASIAQAHGFSTAAVVAARILAKTFGLNQGFSYYDDDMGGAAVERRAEVVTQHALDWLKQNGTKKFFLWVHYFDPHAPYDPPEPFRREYARDPYSGEIAYMDQEVGRLLKGLQQMGFEDRTLVALLGDHGESLGEHGELTHGVFLYDSTLRVPFILAGPGVPRGKVIGDQVRSIDVMPTLVAFLNLDPGPEAQGVSLWPRILKDTPLAAADYSYGETIYPRTVMGWSELRAMRTHAWKLVVAPHPELYNLRNDPGEMHNLYANSSSEAEQLRRQLVRVAGDLSRPQGIVASPMDEKTRRELTSLGYVGGGMRREIQLNTGAPDPKDRIGVLKLFSQFEGLLEKKDYSRAGPIAEAAYRLDPTNPRAHLYLATVYEETSQYPRAIGLLQHAVTAGIRTDRIYSRLGIDYLHTQQTDKAIDALQHATQLNPADLPSLLNLGMAYLSLHRSQDAEKTFRAITAQNAADAAAHDGLGILAAERGDLQGARSEFQIAVDADPKGLKYLLDLGIVYNNIGDRKQSLRYLHLFLQKVQPGQFDDQIPAVREAVRNMEDDERKTSGQP